jgi:hypothetical protein
MVLRDIGFLGPASSDHLQEVEFGVKLILPDEEKDVWSHLTCEGRCMQKSERVCNYALREILCFSVYKLAKFIEQGFDGGKYINYTARTKLWGFILCRII